MKYFLPILLLLLLTACHAQEAPAVPETAEASTAATLMDYPDVPFSTTDLKGNQFTEQVFAEHSLTILNFWEPWCGPCVAEMPYLQKLSEEYADRGIIILGVYSTPNAETEVQQVLKNTGVTYPILHYSLAFDFLQTGYVPTTVIVDSSGRIVHGPTAGALNYAGWVGLVEELL